MPQPDEIQAPAAPATDALPPRTTVQALPRGRHVLAVSQPMDPVAPAPTLERIPFWH